MSSNNFINFCYSNTHRLNVNNTKCNKRITIDLCNQNGKLLEFSLYITDDTDPYYLFLCELDQEGYTLYKENYNINIPFDQFPKQIVKFLRENCGGSNIELNIVEDSKKRPSGQFETVNSCNKENIDGSMPLDYTKSYSPNMNETPNRFEIRHDKYNAGEFTRKSTGEELLYFKIVEKNDFRALTLLKLRLKKASNSDMKHFFNNRINKLVSHIELKNTNESRHLEKIAALEERIAQMEIEITSLSSQNREERDQIKRSVEQKYEHLIREKNDTIEKKNGKIQEITTERNRILDENKRLKENVTELKEKSKVISELNEKIRSKNKRIESYETDIKVYQTKTKKIQQDLAESEKFISSLRMRLAVLEQENGDKQVLVEKLQDLIKLTNENKNQLENNMKSREEMNTKKSENVNVLKKELLKANEIISKITTENTELNKKLSDLSASYRNLKHLFNAQIDEIKEYKTNLDLKENDLSNLMESKKQIYMKFMNTEHELKQKMEKMGRYEKCLSAIQSYLEKVNKSSKHSMVESEIIVFLKDLLVTIS